MSQRNLIILWVLTVVSGAIVFYTNSKSDSDSVSETSLAQGKEVFEDLDLRTVGGLKLVDDNTVTMKIKDDKWTVSEEANYPANVQKLRTAFDKITKLKIVQGVPATAEYHDRFGLKSDAEKEEDRPRAISVINDKGEEIRTIFIGKQRESTGALDRGNSGRFIRFSDDNSGVYVVNEDFNFFTDLTSNWIDKQFIKLGDVLEISSEIKDGDKWKVTRAKASESFEYVGLAEGRRTAISGTNSLKNVFKSGNFSDLLTEEQAKDFREEKEARQISIKTADRVTYNVTLWPEKSESDESEEDKKDGKKKDDTRDYIVTFTVSGEPKAPAEPAKDASEEEKAAYNTAKLNLEKTKKQFERNKALANRLFMVPNSMVKGILKDSNELHQLKPAPAPKPATPAQPSTPPLPGSQPKATAVTPPIAVPPLKVKPATPAETSKPAPRKKRIEAVTPPIAIPPMPKATEPKKADPPKQPTLPGTQPATPKPAAPKPAAPAPKPAAPKPVAPAPKPAAPKPAAPAPKPAAPKPAAPAPKPAAPKPAAPAPEKKAEDKLELIPKDEEETESPGSDF